jgi:hypothetical protein
MLLSIMAPALSMAGTTDMMGTNPGSLRDSAVPGEYYFFKGVEAVRANDYTHAVAMYKVAASWAYKTAEYNLGVIFVKGEGGVPEDHVQGLAWLTLAAERNDAEYVQARDKVRTQLPPEEIAKADALVAELSKVYGDQVALPRAKARWAEVRNSATGSRLGFASGNLQVGAADPRANASQPKVLGSSSMKGGDKGGLKSAMDISGGHSVQGSEAYADLRSTNNPYDPKFDGRVIVGPVGEIEAKPAPPQGDPPPKQQ